LQLEKLAFLVKGLIATGRREWVFLEVLPFENWTLAADVEWIGL